MIQQATSADYQPHRIETLPARIGVLNEAAMTEELLPFTVRVVRDEGDLDKAVQIRHSAYARHLPVFAESLKAAETADADHGVVVLLAESKLDGSPLGTMRIQTNQFKPLCLEQSVELPDWLKTRRLAEATRLGVTDGKGGRLVTTLLFKAFFQYCQQTGIEWMVVTGRAPVDRTYDRLLFEDVFPGRGYIPFSHVGNLPHRVMSFNVETAQVRWAAAKHPLFDFVFRTNHPDLDVSDQRQSFAASMASPSFSTHPAVFAM
jgi:hypothetical protein